MFCDKKKKVELLLSLLARTQGTNGYISEESSPVEQLWWVRLNLTTGELPKFLKKIYMLWLCSMQNLFSCKTALAPSGLWIHHSTSVWCEILKKGHFCCVWATDDSHKAVWEQITQRMVLSSTPHTAAVGAVELPGLGDEALFHFSKCIYFQKHLHAMSSGL